MIDENMPEDIEAYIALSVTEILITRYPQHEGLLLSKAMLRAAAMGSATSYIFQHKEKDDAIECFLSLAREYIEDYWEIQKEKIEKLING